MFKHRNEELALELIISILQTGKPFSIVEKAIERFNNAGETKIANRLLNVKFYIDGGYGAVDSFYYEGFISEETYQYLQLVENKGGLTVNFVKNYLQEYRYRKKMWKEVLGAFVLPLVYVVIASFIGAVLNKQFMNIIMTTTKAENLPEWTILHVFLAQHPLIGGFLAGTSIIVFTLLILYLLFKKVGYKQFKIYNLASVMASLRMQNVPYSEIFSSLATSERDSFFADLYSYIAEEVKTVRIADALSSLYDLLPLNVSLTFQSYLEKGAETEGWNFLKEEIKQIFTIKMELFKNIAPLIGYGFVALVIIFSMLPLAVAIQQLMKTLTF